MLKSLFTKKNVIKGVVGLVGAGLGYAGIKAIFGDDEDYIEDELGLDDGYETEEDLDDENEEDSEEEEA